jgi:hypothetical protein
VSPVIKSVTLAALAPSRPPERPFFDYWNGTYEKPAAFVERLDQAEDYLNERLAASREIWQLDAKTRVMLGLPPKKSGANPPRP